jgi:AcrR family transcriptional regulator
MTRDKETTKEKLLEAVGEILAERGYGALGVNAVAKKAGVDKVLIYRYFANMDGLLEAFILRKDFLSNLESLFGEGRGLRTRGEALSLGRLILTGQLHQILENRELQEILLWELHEKNKVTEKVAEAREKQAVAILSQMARVVDDETTDIAAIASLITGGIYYLALRSRTVEFFSGISLRTHEGWKRIESAVENLVDAVAQKGSDEATSEETASVAPHSTNLVPLKEE